MNLSCIIILLFCEAITIRYVSLPAFLKATFLVPADYMNLPIDFAELIDQMLLK